MKQWASVITLGRGVHKSFMKAQIEYSNCQQFQSYNLPLNVNVNLIKSMTTKKVKLD